MNKEQQADYKTLLAPLKQAVERGNYCIMVSSIADDGEYNVDCAYTNISQMIMALEIKKNDLIARLLAQNTNLRTVK